MFLNGSKNIINYNLMNEINFILEINENNDEDGVNDEVFSEIVNLEPRVSLPSSFIIQNSNLHINNNSKETNYLTRYENNIINNNAFSNSKIEIICKYIGRKRIRKAFKFKKKI